MPPPHGVQSRRRKARQSAPPTEFDQSDKRRDFTIFLVEDDEAVRATLKEALEEKKLAVRDYMTAMEFYRDFREVVPGVLILDIRLPGMSGLELQDKLLEEGFPLPIVMVSGHADVPQAVKSMRNGAIDFLCKPLQPTELYETARRAYDIFYDIDRDIESELDATEDSLDRLTPREREVLDYVVDGLSSREIAVELGVSTKTVEAHRARINDKMRADNVAHLIRMCFNYNAAAAADTPPK